MTDIREIIRDDINGDDLWHDVATALFADMRTKELRELYNYRHSVRGDGMQFATNCFSMIRENKMEMARDYPKDCPFSVAASLAEAYCRAHLFDVNGVSRLIRETLQKSFIIKQKIPSIDLDQNNMCLLAKMAFLFEPEDWLPATSAQQPKIDFLTSIDLSGVLCVACGDSRYFLNYGRQYISGLMAAAHGDGITPMVGVINPDSAAVEEITRLKQDYPRSEFFSIIYSDDNITEFSACARFIVANDLMKHLNMPIIFLDIDSDFPDDFLLWVQRITEHKVSVQIEFVAPPQLIVDACVVAAQPGVLTHAFFDTIARFCLAKLAEEGPLWTVDQVALFRAVSRYRNDITNLYTAFPGYSKSLFKKPHLIDFGRRRDSRSDAAVPWPVGLDGNGKPIYRHRD